VPYSSDVVRRALRRLETNKADHDSLQQARLQEVYRQIPRVWEIDKQLRLL